MAKDIIEWGEGNFITEDDSTPLFQKTKLFMS